MVQAAEMEIKNKQLELDENEQIIDMLKTGSAEEFKKEKDEKDRESKKELKQMEIEGVDKREAERIKNEIIKQNMRDDVQLDMKGLDALVKMAIEQSKEETKNGNEEG